MKQIELYGWEIGMKKISFIKYLNANLNISLIEAKEIETSILDGKNYFLQLPDNISSEDVINNLKTLGVKSKESYGTPIASTEKQFYKVV